MTDRVGQQLGNYHLVRFLGEGGFAQVYLGEHIHLGTQAAIKVLHTQLPSADLDQFRTEARTIARLIHPHIVRVLEFGVEGKIPFLVMDYAPGGTVRQRHPRGVVLPLPLIVAYVKQIADALHYAHDEHIIHRDIKPENMLLGRRNEILLSDFGIALVAQSSRYQSAQELAGTMAYMAPEQIQGKPRPASDQYSLGIVVYEWLSGDRPFHGSLPEMVGQHLSVPPPSLREKFSTIAPQVEQAVLRALAKDPKQRFASVHIFAAALEQASQSLRNSSSASPGVATLPSQSPFPHGLAPSPSQSLHPLSVVPPPTDRSQPTVAATPTRTPLVSPLSTETSLPSAWPLPSTPTITRRTVLVGVAGLATVAVAASSITLLRHRQPSQNPPLAAPTPARTSSASRGAMFGYDLQRTHFNPDEHTLSPTTVSRLVPYWTTSTGDQISYSSPTVAGDVIYVGSQDNKLYAFHVTTGSILWTASTSGAVRSAPTVAGGVVYFGSEDSTFYVLHAATGSILWTASTGGPVGSSPAVVGDVVYVGSLDHKLYAFHVTTGSILWTASTGNWVSSSPALANGVLYIGSWDNKLYAFHAATGNILWAASTGDQIRYSSPAVAGDVVYVGSQDSKLYAFHAATGNILWAASTGGPLGDSSPAVAGGVVYVGSLDHTFYAFHAATGSILWTASTGGPINASPTVANGVVYVGSQDSKLYAFHAATGNVLWTASTGDQIRSSPTVANSVVYVGSEDHKLYAFHLAG